MDLTGIEPATSRLQTKRSTTELKALSPPGIEPGVIDLQSIVFPLHHRDGIAVLGIEPRIRGYETRVMTTSLYCLEVLPGIEPGAVRSKLTMFPLHHRT